MGWTGSPARGTGSGGEDARRSAAARRASPRVSPPPGAPVSAEPRLTPRSAGQARRSLHEGACGSQRQAGYPGGLGRPQRLLSAVARQQQQHPRSVLRRGVCLPAQCLSLRLPQRLSPNRAAEVHGVRLRFLVGRGRTPSLRREKCLATHWEIGFEEPNEKSHFSTAVSQFAVWRRQKAPKLPGTRQNVLSPETPLPPGRKV